MYKSQRFYQLQLVVILYSLTLFPSLCQADVTLTVGKGSGFPASSGIPVSVSLVNHYEQVRAVQLDICDMDDYLSCIGCETTDRTNGFSCSNIELENGCCRIILFAFDESVIELGEGSIFNISYDISNEAPYQECRILNPYNVIILDNNAPSEPLVVITEPGGFCFPCTADDDCNDGLFCNGIETCDAGNGTCNPGNGPCEESCNEENDVCLPYICKCDLNGDGTITPQDALCAFQKYLGICPTTCGPCEEVCCDVNQDGSCTPADALCTFQEYLGIKCEYCN